MTRASVLPTLVVALALAGCPFERTTTETSGATTPPEARPEDTKRIRDLEAENRRLRAVTRAHSESKLPVVAEPAAPTLTDAVELHADGDAAGAVEQGLQVLDVLNEAGVDAPRLAMMLGEWALEAAEPALAERLFAEAGAAADGLIELVEEARIRGAVARATALGPDAAALAEAVALSEGGNLGGAVLALDTLIDSGEDTKVLTDAQVLRTDLVAEAQELATERLDRADAVLASEGPWDAVAELLDAVESLPEGTWDTAEVRRLRAWYRSRAKEAGSEAVVAEDQRLQHVLAEARAHVAAERYRDAVVAYRELEGTALQTRARDESRSSVDTFVKAERERAAKLFVSARKKPDATLKKEALEGVAVLLRGLLTEFPESTYASRVRDNLKVVEKELAKML
jgi:hypothetical protein